MSTELFCWKLDIKAKRVWTFPLLCIFIKIRKKNLFLYLMCMYVLVAWSCTILCNPIDHSPPGPSILGILQAWTLEWVVISLYKKNYRNEKSEVTQSYLTLCDPMNGSLPGYSIHGIFQARVQEWVAISFSRGSSQSRHWILVSCIVAGFFTIWATKEALNKAA